MKKPYTVPSFYIDGHIRDFDPIARQYGLEKKSYPKGSLLTTPGTINNTAHYVWSGTVHLSLSNSKGDMKSLFFYGPNTVFPLGVEPHINPIDYEMTLEAFTDVVACDFPYPLLRKMCVENGEFAAELLEQNCISVGYLYYQQMNFTYSPIFIRVCDVLYIYLVSVPAVGGVIPLGQRELANLAGCSRPQIERVLGTLRAEGIIATGRGQVVILDRQRLARKCSDSLQQNFGV